MTRPRRRVYVHLTSTGPQETPDPFERGLVGFSRCHRTSHITRTLRVEARLASLVLRHLVRGVLLAPLAVGLLRFRHLFDRETVIILGQSLRAIFASCAGLPAVGFATASPAAAVKLMRLAPVCRGFAQMAHVLVPKDVATEAKLQQMTLHLVGFFDLKDVAPWTAEMVVDDGYASMMEIAGWMAVNIDESWAQTNRIGRLLLNDREGCGGLEKVRKRIKMAPSTKGCLLYTSPSPRDLSTSRMPSSA